MKIRDLEVLADQSLEKFGQYEVIYELLKRANERGKQHE